MVIDNGSRDILLAVISLMTNNEPHAHPLQVITPATAKIIRSLIAIAFIIIINGSCKNENHIDKYKINLDSLKTLPDNFYAYRRGSIYIEDVKAEYYRIWFNTDEAGNVQSVFKIENFKDLDAKSEMVIKVYTIDTSLNKGYAQKFIDLSRQYKFGHISIDKKNKISFSYKDGLAEQYVKALNDSMAHVYADKKYFTLLPNGWFENVDQ